MVVAFILQVFITPFRFFIGRDLLLSLFDEIFNRSISEKISDLRLLSDHTEIYSEQICK